MKVPINFAVRSSPPQPWIVKRVNTGNPLRANNRWTRFSLPLELIALITIIILPYERRSDGRNTGFARAPHRAWDSLDKQRVRWLMIRVQNINGALIRL